MARSMNSVQITPCRWLGAMLSGSSKVKSPLDYAKGRKSTVHERIVMIIIV